MISIKGGTQTWSTAEQVSALKSDKAHDMSATDRQKYFGDEPIGDILNKVADPNWVDPAKTRRVGNNELDKDAFMKLLLAQLKNQDPTMPLKSHEMAAQLAQFSSLEKLANIDTGIGKLATASQPKQDFDALNLIGKSVSGDSGKIIRVEGDTNHEVVYELMGDASTATIKVRGPDGKIVREVQAHNLPKGKNKFTWNGLNEDGQPLPAGEYQVFFEAKNSSGKKIHATTDFQGVISGVNFTAEGPLLMIGNKTVRMSDVKKIVDPAQLKNESTATASTPEANTQEKKLGAPPAPVNSGLQDVAMNQDMINRLNKEVGQE